MNSYRIFIALFLFTFAGKELLQAQHEMQQQMFGNQLLNTESAWDSLNQVRGIYYNLSEGFGKRSSADSCQLDRIVFGWHPYWMGTAYEGYDYNVLSDLSYFSYEVDPTTGNYQSIHSWKTTDLVTRAKAAGRRVNLCVTLFSSHATLFNNPEAKQTLIDSLVVLVKLRDADGVNIDFEAISSSQRDNLTAFMKQLGERFHSEIPGSQISMALPAVDWQKTFDVIGMEPYVDLFIIMGYAYHYSGSSNAGPNAPKNNGSFWSAIDLTRSVNYYLDLGLPSHKLCLGLPWYGQNWITANDQLGAATQARGTALFYSATRQDVDTNKRERLWDVHSSTPWYTYQVAENVWRQTWYDDEESLGMKYDLAIMKDLAGVAIWALGYDGGYIEMWETLRGRFANCGRTPCRGEITDMGGSTGNYFENDNWHYTIAPEGATSISIAFSQFDLADDHLLLYDGLDESAPLLADLTGSGTTAPVAGRSGALSLRFLSNGSQQGTGFIGDWSCSTVPLSVESENNTQFSAILFPNPTGEESTLQLDLVSSAEIQVTLYSVDGRELTKVVRKLPEGRSSINLEEITNLLTNGLYILRVQSDQGEEITLEFIKAE
ncbi:MAG: T9SS type A sorting domain-containing protein [Ignavibacteriae bacterium]|nr:T9SS type A sorting domain-containing protein [Ignavibacteriota bacterium]MCB9217714.1 T9SS type A sorting domain-containing protein [Ignavibacteria bacterium]